MSAEDSGENRHERSGHPDGTVSSRGRRVRTLLEGVLPAGPHTVRLTAADDTPAGVYFVRLSTPDGVRARTVIRTR